MLGAAGCVCMYACRQRDVCACTHVYVNLPYTGALVMESARTIITQSMRVCAQMIGSLIKAAAASYYYM